jgi:hypothetical protein
MTQNAYDLIDRALKEQLARPGLHKVTRSRLWFGVGELGDKPKEWNRSHGWQQREFGPSRQSPMMLS